MRTNLDTKCAKIPFEPQLLKIHHEIGLVILSIPCILDRLAGRVTFASGFDDDRIFFERQTVGKFHRPPGGIARLVRISD